MEDKTKSNNIKIVCQICKVKEGKTRYYNQLKSGIYCGECWADIIYSRRRRHQ